MEEIHQRWGYEVKYLVEKLTEPPSEPPIVQKAVYISQISLSDPAVAFISCADKLHNLRCYASTGQQLWRQKIAKFYDELLAIYQNCNRIPRHWLDEMREGVLELEKSRELVLMIENLRGQK